MAHSLLPVIVALIVPSPPVVAVSSMPSPSALSVSAVPSHVQVVRSACRRSVPAMKETSCAPSVPAASPSVPEGAGSDGAGSEGAGHSVPSRR